MLSAECSELCNLSKVELIDLHCRHYHIEGLLSTGPHRDTHCLHTREHRDQALVEAEIPNATFYFPILHQEGSIAGHAGYDFFVRINLADVPQPGNEYAALGRSNHLLQTLWILGCAKNYIHRHLTYF